MMLALLLYSYANGCCPRGGYRPRQGNRGSLSMELRRYRTVEGAGFRALRVGTKTGASPHSV
jgi:hypothetical protein